MKKILGLVLCLGLFSTTLVSFASDGSQTTKECVVDNLDVMETAVVVGELNYSFVNSNDFTHGFDSLFNEADKAFDNIEKHRTYIEEIYKKYFIFIDPGVMKSNLLNHYNKIETNGLAFKFEDKNCLTRYLSIS